jgi:hypothetical protein
MPRLIIEPYQPHCTGNHLSYVEADEGNLDLADPARVASDEALGRCQAVEETNLAALRGTK